MKVLLFGGTSEGRILAGWLAERGASVTLCVATEYGASLTPEDERIDVRTGRLNRTGMELLLAEGGFHRVVDATHPYAMEVTKNLCGAAESQGVPYLRLVREGVAEGSWLHVPHMEGAAKVLEGIPGNVLLTTGSKELDAFADPDLRERCFPRVLPSLDSLGRCLDLGFPPAHVLCMQGPFSRELNVALMRQYEIRSMVTKASGGAGGFWDKVAAAQEVDCTLVVVDRPVQESGLSLEEMKKHLEEELQ